MLSLRLGTRKSALALAQSGQVARALEACHPGTRIELVTFVTTGDRTLGDLAEVGGRADDHEGIVEFRATYLEAGRVGVLHERSRFVREADRWYYLDGDVRSGTADDASG